MVGRPTAPIDASVNGMAVPDTDGEYVYVDAAYAEQYGYDVPSALVGQDWRPLYDEQGTGRTGRGGGR